MSEETGDSRFLEAILNRVFDAVSEHGSFDEESVKHLKELARSKDMTTVAAQGMSGGSAPVHQQIGRRQKCSRRHPARMPIVEGDLDAVGVVIW